MRIYRITGVPHKWDSENRSVPGDRRVTVQRSQKSDYAYYEDEAHARNGLKGLRSNNHVYGDLRIETLDGDWEVMG